MAEGIDSSSVDKEKTKGDKRREGDGFEPFIQQTSDHTLTGANADVPAKLNNHDQMAANKSDAEVQIAKKGVETEGKEASLVDSGSRKPASARAGSASQRDLRQFRHLQNQELIRRILQSTGVIPYNSPSSLAIEKRSKTENTKETKEKDSSTIKQVTAEKINDRAKERDIVEVGNEEGRELKKAEVNFQENKRREIKMQSDLPFVCTKCEACKHQDDKPQSTLRQGDEGNSSGELSYFSVPKTEKEEEKVEEDSLDSVPVSQQDEVNVLNSGKTKVEELSDRLQKHPNQETLEEILKLLQNQALMHPVDKENKKEDFEPEVPAISEESQEELEWKQQQQLQQKLLMMG